MPPGIVAATARPLLAGLRRIAVAAALIFPPAVMAQAQTAATVAAGDQYIQLSLGKAEVIRLPRPVADVLIANPAIADVVVKTPQLIYVIGNAVGDTNAFFVDADGQQILRAEIRVELDLTALRRALDRLLPGAGIEVQAINSNIVVSGTVASAATADDVATLARRFAPANTEIVNRLNVTGGDQVMMRVRIAEMRRSVVKQLGIRSILNRGDATLDVGNRLSTSAGSLNISAAGGLFDLAQVDVDLLETHGLVRILAEPNLTAMSGESASFLAGGEYPVPVGFDPESGLLSFEFRPYGVSLNFTPLVLDKGRISLDLQTEVSSLSDEGAVPIGPSLSVQSLQVRRVRTTVELPSGGSLAIAGVLSNDGETNISGVPGLKDLPILGPLFRSTEYQRNETELVILITPYIVKPAAERQLALPTQGYAAPSDADLFWYGRLASAYGGPPTPAALEGPIGFMLP